MLLFLVLEDLRLILAILSISIFNPEKKNINNINMMSPDTQVSVSLLEI